MNAAPEERTLFLVLFQIVSSLAASMKSWPAQVTLIRIAAGPPLEFVVAFAASTRPACHMRCT